MVWRVRLVRSWKIGIHSDMVTPVEAEAVSSSSVVSGGGSISSEVIDNTSTNNVKVRGTSHGELVVTVEAVRSNCTRRNDSGDGVLYTLNIPRRLAYEWYRSTNYDYLMMLNKSVKEFDLDVKNGLLQNRIKSKFTEFGYLLSTKRGGPKALS